jgi:UDP-N-acetylmuramoyl-L-alanyl-D-glutamate--2,6-diaminopimelate ligase
MTMLHHCAGRKYTFALKTMADFKAKILESQFSGQLLSFDNKEVWSRIVGEFNAYNLLAIYATAVLLGEDQLQALTSISALNSAEGRFDVVESKTGVIGVIDYAHTPDALKNVLHTILEIKEDNQNLISIVGCGGDRDNSKRPLMGNISAQNSNKVIFTSDNPRSEDPNQILQEMADGVSATLKKKTLIINDRREAIKTACSLVNTGDIILLAGKGHEKYQEIDGEKLPFDDKEELKTAFKLLNL